MQCFFGEQPRKMRFVTQYPFPFEGSAMFSHAKRFAAAACLCGAAFALGQPASAQVRQQPAPLRLFQINPNPQIAPGVSLQQYAFNVAVLGKAYKQVPPYLLGYSPYPQSVNFGPQYNPQIFRPAGYNPLLQPAYGPVLPPNVPNMGGYNPLYGGSPYTGGYTAGGVDPLAGGYSTAGAGGYNPYYWNPYNNGYMYSDAATLQSIGQLGISQEQARIMRETANQAKLDTRKKLVDTLAYIRANEYTFTKEQADISKRILERLQKTPTQQEVTSGKSLNVLIDDLSKFRKDQLHGPTVTLDEDILKQLIVSSPGPNGNIGLLRDNGRFSFPTVFDDKLFDPKLKKDIELQAQELFQQSLNGKLDKNALKDLQSNLRTLRETLTKNLNQLLGQNYLDGQRFLDDFDSALLALDRGAAPLNYDYQQKFAKGGRTVIEVIEYMTSRGLKFVPATSGDERAYNALQTALAAHSLAVHNQVSAAPKE